MLLNVYEVLELVRQSSLWF